MKKSEWVGKKERVREIEIKREMGLTGNLGAFISVLYCKPRTQTLAFTIK